MKYNSYYAAAIVAILGYYSVAALSIWLLFRCDRYGWMTLVIIIFACASIKVATPENGRD